MLLPVLKVKMCTENVFKSLIYENNLNFVERVNGEQVLSYVVVVVCNFLQCLENFTSLSPPGSAVSTDLSQLTLGFWD